MGRNLLRPEPFSLNVDKQPGFTYHAYHVTHELDLMLEMLDREKPQVIVNYAAQGEGAVSWKHSWRFFETNSMALARLCEELMKRPWLERFIQIGTSEMYGSVEHAAKEDEPIKPSSPYAASKVAFDMYLDVGPQIPQIPDEHHPAVQRLLPGAAAAPRDPESGLVAGLTGRKLPLHGGGRAEKSYIHARDLARAIKLVAEGAPLGTIYNAGPKDPTSIRRRRRAHRRSAGHAVRELCEVTGDRLGQDSRYWLDSSAHQARCRLGAADRLGGRPGRDGGVGPQIPAAAARLADRLRAARLKDDYGNGDGRPAEQLRCRGGAAALSCLSQAHPRNLAAGDGAACGAGLLVSRDGRPRSITA